MKGSERHRLKENELSHALGDLTAGIREHQRTAALAGGIVVLLLVAGGGYWAWTARSENRAQAALGEAIVVAQSPVEEGKPGAQPTAGTYPTPQARAEASLEKFTEVYTSYPSTQAGIAARYYAAAALAMLGRPAEAASRFQEVVDRAGTNSFYGRMAQLGVVDASAQAKQYDQAIRVAQALVDRTGDDTMPRDALLMELGRVQAAAGKKAEAKQTLDRMVAEFPDSPYIEEAERLLAEGT